MHVNLEQPALSLDGATANQLWRRIVSYYSILDLSSSSDKFDRFVYNDFLVEYLATQTGGATVNNIFYIHKN